MTTLFFGWFLERIHYWANLKNDLKHDITVGLVELDVPQDNGNIANIGVLVCMMMENLVANKPLQIEDESKQLVSTTEDTWPTSYTNVVVYLINVSFIL